jgi:hypothetical protein
MSIQKITSAFFIFFSFLSCNAQQWNWIYPIDCYWGSSFWKRNIQTDTAGNAIFTGRCDPSSITLNGTNGSFSYSGLNTFVSKYDVTGNIIWTGGGWGNYIETNSISVDRHSNVFLTGDFGSTASFGTGADTLQRTALTGSREFFLVKLNKDGKAVFMQKDGGSCTNPGISITACSSDELLLSWIDQTYCNFGSSEILYFKKVDNDGNEVWSIPSAQIIYQPENITSTTNGFLVSGSWFGDPLVIQGMSGNTTLAAPVPENITDAFIAKYTLDGNVHWAKAIRGANYQGPIQITVDSSTNILLGLSAYDTTIYDNNMLTPCGARTLYIIKSDSSGNLLHYIGFPASNYTKHFNLSELRTDPHGNVYLLGRTDTTLYIGNDSIPFNLSAYQRAFVVIKLDPDLNYLWSQYSYGRANWIGSMAITDSVVYVGMSYDGAIYFHDSNQQFPTPAATTAYYSFVAAIHNTNISTSVNEIISPRFTIAPNPTRGILNINLNERCNATVLITDVLGNQLVKINDREISSLSIDLSSQPKGIYFLELIAGNRRETKKIIVE